ncbi:hypothetical protein E2C01_102405 [Portunus trituberculatus]|uniref:Uncharacterized protein n=1 Tax=Portunus trituberculatus TaxID=210409 RepID=A0A5B7KIG4_PORTR|nr:hypothetical protein [Portunus trituberculatus]
MGDTTSKNSRPRAGGCNLMWLPPAYLTQQCFNALHQTPYNASRLAKKDAINYASHREPQGSVIRDATIWS